MFVTLNRVNREQLARQKAREEAAVARSYEPPPAAPEDEPRTRIFRVPPPPEPGQQPFAARPETVEEASDDESVQELIARLLENEETTENTDRDQRDQRQ